MEKLYLTIDHGNSSAKLSLHIGDKPVATSTVGRPTADAVRDLTGGRDLAGIILGSVAGYDSDLIPSLASMAPVVIELTPDTPLPIGIDYDSKATLGVDRIAAAAAAAEIFPGQDVIVVDAGTAVTVDHVDSTGTFRGGNIAPGLSLQLDSLHSHTARLPQVNIPRHPSPHPRLTGTDTPSAILAGCLTGIAGAVEYVARRIVPGSLPAVVVTGGNSRLIAPYLADLNAVTQPDLVDKGLYRILRYNENI